MGLLCIKVAYLQMYCVLTLLTYNVFCANAVRIPIGLLIVNVSYLQTYCMVMFLTYRNSVY